VYVSAEKDARRRGNLIQLQPVPGYSDSMSSTWQRLARSAASIETDYLNGEIVLLGREVGIPTPVNELLQELGPRAIREQLQPHTVRGRRAARAGPPAHDWTVRQSAPLNIVLTADGY
jgi:Ketopantoate reductase PanE/ApbA C terminal